MISNEKATTESKHLNKSVKVLSANEQKKKLLKTKFEQIAKDKYGVNAHYSSKNLLKAFFTNKALEKVSKAGFDLKGLNIRSTTAGDKEFLPLSPYGAVDGATITYTPNIYLRKSIPPKMKDLDWGRVNWKSSGGLGTPEPEHAAVHEIGHYLNFKEKEKIKDFDKKDIVFTLNKKTQDNLKNKVSQYASTSQYEGVAEIFTGLILGKNYDKDTMEFYHAMQGPANKTFDKMVETNAAKAKLPKPKYALDDLILPSKKELTTKMGQLTSGIERMSKRALTTDDIPAVKGLSHLGTIVTASKLNKVAKIVNAVK